MAPVPAGSGRMADEPATESVSEQAADASARSTDGSAETPSEGTAGSTGPDGHETAGDSDEPVVDTTVHGDPVSVSPGGHLIVVGYDAWTEPVLDELADRDCTVTLVATDPAVVDRVADRDVEVVLSEDVDAACFAEAGIDRADAVLVATLDDQRNVLAVLTARTVDPDVEVATFAGEARDVPKLRAAGANRVISLGESVAALLVEVALTERAVADVVAEIADGAP